MERTWIREILFNIEKGYEDVEGGGGAEILCARGLSKIGMVKGEGIKSGYRTNGLIA